MHILKDSSEHSMTDLRCMSFTSKGTNEILVAGCQEQMYKLDVEKGVILQTVSPPLVSLHSDIDRTRSRLKQLTR